MMYMDSIVIGLHIPGSNRNVLVLQLAVCLNCMVYLIVHFNIILCCFYSKKSYGMLPYENHASG